MTTAGCTTKARPPAICIATDECAELFEGDRETSEEFERTVADALALLNRTCKHPTNAEER
ncbi:hypothetical protein [Glycomyces buryatensis]|uniref:Uncharacterized protein n=1 Tax=Glycomyces buryatensis TaxID=2570927 RepID=A0A4S8QAN5_9ACTN|nr:hypothetical protein [Glycomyces buryatensis]THV40561.1 hypothetical protein FAB82_14945 [Glycomyces buryatensis]